MTLGSRHGAVLAGLGSAGLLLGALGFQFLGELPPCPLCIWQRWPHAAAVVIALLFVWKPGTLLALCGAASMLVGTSIAIWHAGIEQKWWEGPSTCTSSSVEGMSADALLQQILTAPIVRCDEIAWSMLGLSMAAWNGLISIGFILLWTWSASRLWAKTRAVTAGAGHPHADR